jgi:hypothetical protein
MRKPELRVAGQFGWDEKPGRSVSEDVRSGKRLIDVP